MPCAMSVYVCTFLAKAAADGWFLPHRDGRCRHMRQFAERFSALSFAHGDAPHAVGTHESAEATAKRGDVQPTA